MPKNPTATTTTIEDKPQTEPVVELETAKPQVPEMVKLPVIKHTLPELVGGFITRIMADPKATNQCAQELQMWYDAQDVENRRELITEHRKVIERAKQATEFLFGQYLQIASKDM